MSERIDGYIILGPNNDAMTATHTFGRSPVEAWERHMGPRTTAKDRPIIRQHWRDKGWRPVPAYLVVMQVTE